MIDKYPDGQRVLIFSPGSWYQGLAGRVTGKHRTSSGVEVAFTVDAMKDMPVNQRNSPVWMLYSSMKPDIRKRMSLR